MASEEKSVWIYLVVAIAGYATYLGLVLSQDVPLPEADYVAPMLWTIGGAIVGSMVLHALFRVYTGPEKTQKDERDRQIARYGEYGGQAFLVAGALAALVLAILEVDHFWIGNAIYLAFVLSAVLGSIIKITAYRGGMPG